ncbi:hypothetical protein NIES4075_46530 [Tolypothrix sp. NIES-4075]|uniref:hypothetical protein n=1 Tax=Tolypothrix sp. NIES-4075 TaxID=2005459 RepID=UPI000B666842|nr:hypothetical protein [Tolypothrix sp. NIES-4075]GAX43638.1 hypothetical protein NIES4075_46530 [Tolypothrix sp. NIES-4075]
MGNGENQCSQLPTTNYQLPITNYQLPTTNYQLPITNPKLYYCSIEGVAKTLLDIGIRGLDLVAGMALLEEAIGLLLVGLAELLDIVDVFVSPVGD